MVAKQFRPISPTIRFCADVFLTLQPQACSPPSHMYVKQSSTAVTGGFNVVEIHDALVCMHRTW